jgi:endoglucanase
MHNTIKTFLAAGAIFLSISSQGATTAFNITDNMMPGWNLGNSLDALGGETNWGNPATTQAMIDAVKKAGFKTLRVPVSWDEYASGSAYTISSTRLDRVEQVINYGLNDGMYVIVNVHHTSSNWEYPTTANEATAKARLQAYWQQIATRFKAYDNHLIFEVMNEPRYGDDWWGTSEYLSVINDLNAAALSTIRATGGNNASRLVMLPTYAAAPYDYQVNAFTVPSDSMVAVSVHAYLPYDFALNQSGTSSFTDTATLDSLFSRLQTAFVAKGVPVVLGEWGATSKSNTAERVKHALYFVKGAAKVRIPVILWDNNAFSGSGDIFGQLNRSTLAWGFPDIITAIQQGTASWTYSSSSSSSSSAASSSVSSASSSSKASSSASSASSSKASSSSSSSSSKASSSSSSSKASSSAASSSKASSSSSSAASSSSSSSKASSSTGSGSVTASYKINNDWTSGYCAVVTLTNSSASAVTWVANMAVSGTINQMWNANWTQSGSTVSFSGAGWNASLAAGASSSDIGFCATR